MSNTQNVDPCPLERPVGRVDGEIMPGTEGFGSSDLEMVRDAHPTRLRRRIKTMSNHICLPRYIDNYYQYYKEIHEGIHFFERPFLFCLHI